MNQVAVHMFTSKLVVAQTFAKRVFDLMFRRQGLICKTKVQILHQGHRVIDQWQASHDDLHTVSEKYGVYIAYCMRT